MEIIAQNITIPHSTTDVYKDLLLTSKENLMDGMELKPNLFLKSFVIFYSFVYHM